MLAKNIRNDYMRYVLFSVLARSMLSIAILSVFNQTDFNFSVFTNISDIKIRLVSEFEQENEMYNC